MDREYQQAQIADVLRGGPQQGEDFYRIKISGREQTNWFNITPAQLAALLSPPKIEMVVVRDPDGFTEVQVFVDGVETQDYAQYNVDAGAGHMLSEWVEETRSIAGDERLTPAFRAAAVEARLDPPGGEYIEDDRTPPRDIAWNLHSDEPLLQLWEDYPNLDEQDKDKLDAWACEQVSKMFVDVLLTEGWDAWLMHGDDAESVDGMIGDHYWVAVEDEGMTAHYDLTYKQFHNVADPAIALAVDAAAGEWPLQWHTYPSEPRHEIVPYRTITRPEK